MQICTAASCRLCMRLLYLTWAIYIWLCFFCESNAKCLKLNGNQLFDNFVAAALNLLRLLSVEKWNFTTISVIAWNQIACVEYFPCVDFPVSLSLSSYQYVPLQRRALLVIVDYIFTHRETHRQHLFGASAQTHMTDICWRTFNYFSLVSVWDEISYHLTLCINTITTKLFVLSISLSHIHTEIQNLHLSIYLLFDSLTVCVCVCISLSRAPLYLHWHWLLYLQMGHIIRSERILVNFFIVLSRRFLVSSEFASWSSIVHTASEYCSYGNCDIFTLCKHHMEFSIELMTAVGLPLP